MGVFYSIRKLIQRKRAGLCFAKNIRLSLERPLISFTFDDAPGVAFDNGGAILSQYDVKGTFYVSLQLMRPGNDQAFFTDQHLKGAYLNKHELGCHTFGHIHLCQTLPDKAELDMESNRRMIKTVLPEAELNNFSYPFGEQTLAVKKLVGRHYRSARGVGKGINYHKTDILNLRAIRLYEAKYPLKEVFKQLDKVEKLKGWLIFYTHDVQENPTPWGCSPAYFEAVVKETLRRELTVLTVGEALNVIGVPVQASAKELTKSA
jgi:peptidoglycan/xylan/chitin deacetylase (PgdA/CDA1 family)